jgi:8-oxo-dGTP pyrophosphatase MutT (NUDIX family)
MDVGESVQETAKREVYEETNIIIDKLNLLNVYSGEKQHHIYPNGDEVYFVNVIFVSTSYRGSLETDGIESTNASLVDLPNNISPTNKPFIEKSIRNSFY